MVNTNELIFISFSDHLFQAQKEAYNFVYLDYAPLGNCLVLNKLSYQHLVSSVWVLISCFSRVRPFVIPQTAACQAPLSKGFFRQEDWRELSCPSPGDLPNPGIKPTPLLSPALQADSLLMSHQGSSLYSVYYNN